VVYRYPACTKESQLPKSWLSPFKRAALAYVDSLMILVSFQGLCPPFGGQLAVIWRSKLCYSSSAMAANRKAECRLSEINHAYLKDLAKLGAYGDGISGVMRRFIENGIQEALEKKVIAPKDVSDFGASSLEGDD
jgi:hypothetical protein